MLNRKDNTLNKREAHAAQIDIWEYCYCESCDRIRYHFELKATAVGIRCSKCGSYDLEAPAWIFCPHAMFLAATKCPRGGKGIIKGKNRIECNFRCSFRKP
jgi:hypothetical protein